MVTHTFNYNTQETEAGTSEFGPARTDSETFFSYTTHKVQREKIMSEIQHALFVGMRKTVGTVGLRKEGLGKGFRNLAVYQVLGLALN